MRWVVASLAEKSWVYRAFEVTTSEGTYRVAYDGRGIGYESVSVNGDCVVKSAAEQWWTLGVVPELRFSVGSRPALVRVSVWPWLTIRTFCLEVDGQEVYSEGADPV